MPNKKYTSGRYFEYRVRNYLHNLGWTVFRSAGSHTMADLVALKPGKVLLVQCKFSVKPTLSLKARTELMNECIHLQAMNLIVCKSLIRKLTFFSVSTSNTKLLSYGEAPLWVR